MSCSICVGSPLFLCLKRSTEHKGKFCSSKHTQHERPIIDDFIDRALDDLPLLGSKDDSTEGFIDGANEGFLVGACICVGATAGPIDSLAVMLGLSPILIINVLNSLKFFLQF